MKAVRNFFVTGLVATAAIVATGLYANNMGGSSTMSPPKNRLDPDRGRYVVVQMTWKPERTLNNIRVRIGASGRETSFTTAAKALTDPVRRTGYVKSGDSVSFGWMTVAPIDSFTYQVFLDGQLVLHDTIMGRSNRLGARDYVVP